MAGSTSKGRKNRSGRYVNTVRPESAEQAILKKQDEIIDIMKAMAAKLDADAGVTDVDYASTLTDALEKVKLQ